MTWVNSERIRPGPLRHLMAHIASSAIIFITVFTVCWLVSLCFDSLNTIHRFPPRVYTLVGQLEIWVFYLDCVLSGYLLVFGAVKFVIHTLEDDD